MHEAGWLLRLRVCGTDRYQQDHATVLAGTSARNLVKKKQASAETLPRPARERILHAAMEAFMEFGYNEASTLKIATHAQVSKRELYALFGSKQAMLAACVAERAGRMQMPAELVAVSSREELQATLSKLGSTVLREVSQPAVMAVFRLAIMEAQRAPEVAATLESARQTIRTVVRDMLARAQSNELIGAGDPAAMGNRYLALLWDDLMISLLLHIREAPGKTEIARRAKDASENFLQLHPPSVNQPRRGSPKSQVKPHTSR
jgi:AcrR family transcriptional regulator